MQDQNPFMSVKTVRLVGVMYLFVIIFAGFSQGYVRGSLIVPGDAMATASNITLNAGLFRLGLTSDILAFLLDAVISVMLYQMFRPFNKTLALVSSALRLIAHPAIASLNLLNHYLALTVLEGAGISPGISAIPPEAMSLLFLEAHRYGYLIAGVFFGVHCLLLGILIYRSNIFPKIFGGLLIGAAAGYLLESFGNFSMPGNEASLALIVGIFAALGEVGLTFYILIKGTTKSYLKTLKIQ